MSASDSHLSGMSRASDVILSVPVELCMVVVMSYYFPRVLPPGDVIVYFVNDS